MVSYLFCAVVSYIEYFSLVDLLVLLYYRML